MSNDVRLFSNIDRIEYYLPKKLETLDDLLIENPNWSYEDIKNKTGITKRFISNKNETALDLATIASKKILDNNKLKLQIDVLIFVTQSPDYFLPASACIIQNNLGLKTSCMSFDVNQGCSGFVYGLALSSSLIEAKFAKKVLLLCSDTYTKYINKSDRTCRPIFSDGAAAILISANAQSNIGPFELGTDGNGAKNLIVKNGSSRFPINQKQKKEIFMDGANVFMFSMSEVPKCVKNLLKTAKKKIEDIDLFFFHQASKVVIDNILRKLNIPKEKCFCNYDQIGNTVSASIPIALKNAENKGILKKGDLIMTIGFGVGYSWGANLIQWNSK